MSEQVTRQKNADEKFCHECGNVIRVKAEICPKCGVRQILVPRESNRGESTLPGHRVCTDCGYSGPMKTWLRNYNAAQLIAVVLLLFWIIPGVIFIAWFWGKYKCPSCGKVGANHAA